LENIGDSAKIPSKNGLNTRKERMTSLKKLSLEKRSCDKVKNFIYAFGISVLLIGLSKSVNELAIIKDLNGAK
jgi:hypothetical protein